LVACFVLVGFDTLVAFTDPFAAAAHDALNLPCLSFFLPGLAGFSFAIHPASDIARPLTLSIPYHTLWHLIQHIEYRQTWTVLWTHSSNSWNSLSRGEVLVEGRIGTRGKVMTGPSVHPGLDHAGAELKAKFTSRPDEQPWGQGRSHLQGLSMGLGRL